MDDATQSLPRLSVHVMLPEAIDRRLERWTDKMPGTSWPAWGGHITLIPNFTARSSVDDVRAALIQVCAQEAPFVARFGAPLAVPDVTRPGYFAIFLSVESGDMAVPHQDGSNESVQAAEEEVAVPLAKEAQVASSPLHALRARLLAALATLRDDVYPELLERPFLPHVTVGLGLAESEARKVVRELRAEPVTAAFQVEVVWLVMQTVGEGGRFQRQPLPLGQLASAELWRD